MATDITANNNHKRQIIDPARTEANLERIKRLQTELENGLAQAEKETDPYLFGIYKDLIKVTSPILTKATARLEREKLALFNKRHKQLKDQEPPANGQETQ
jgi:hypothetical protein